MQGCVCPDVSENQVAHSRSFCLTQWYFPSFSSLHAFTGEAGDRPRAPSHGSLLQYSQSQDWAKAETQQARPPPVGSENPSLCSNSTTSRGPRQQQEAGLEAELSLKEAPSWEAGDGVSISSQAGHTVHPSSFLFRLTQRELCTMTVCRWLCRLSWDACTSPLVCQHT